MANAFLQFILTKNCPPFIMYYASGRSLTPEGIFIPEGKSVPFWLFCYCSESLNIDRCSSNACIRKNIWQYLFDEEIAQQVIKLQDQVLPTMYQQGQSGEFLKLNFTGNDIRWLLGLPRTHHRQRISK